MHVSSLDENGNHLTELQTMAVYFPAQLLTKEQLDAATTYIVFRDCAQYYVPFTDDFTYLGSHITMDLKDMTDINNQIHQTKGQAAALGNFFHTNANPWSK
jgi:hypothetical protein